MIKTVINSVTPPIIKQFVTLIRSRYQKQPQPEWIKFKEGVLKDLAFLIDPQSSIGILFLHGHDDFIYAHIKEHKSMENPIFYDIGSHFGFHTLGFSKIAGKNGKVYAFEPNPLNKERLTQNIAANSSTCDNIIVIDKAITDYKGSVLFEMITDIESGWSSNSKILEIDTAGAETNSKKHINVNTDTIDNLIQQEGILKPDFIKIDVEGEEYKVLKGGIKSIRLYKPILFIEIHTIECMFLIQKLLSDIEYSIELIHKETDGRCFIKAYSN